MDLTGFFLKTPWKNRQPASCPPFPLGERKGAFDAKCQKCFCVTLDKSNRTEDEQVYKIGGIYNAKNDKCNGG